MPSIEQLLKVGEIAPLQFFMTREEVVSLIGSPEGDYEDGTVLIDKHGPFQLHFGENTLKSINWLLSDSSKSGFSVTGEVPTTTTTVQEFLDFCDNHNIAWSILQKQTFDRQLAIQTCSNVVAIFDLDFREMQRIIMTANN